MAQLRLQQGHPGAVRPQQQHQHHQNPADPQDGRVLQLRPAAAPRRHADVSLREEIQLSPEHSLGPSTGLALPECSSSHQEENQQGRRLLNPPLYYNYILVIQLVLSAQPNIFIFIGSRYNKIKEVKEIY